MKIINEKGWKRDSRIQFIEIVQILLRQCSLLLIIQRFDSEVDRYFDLKVVSVK